MQIIYLVVRKETSQKVQVTVKEEEEMLISNNKVDNHRIIHRNNMMDMMKPHDHEHNIGNIDKREIPQIREKNIFLFLSPAIYKNYI